MAAKGPRGRQHICATSNIAHLEMMLKIYKEKLKSEQDPEKRRRLEADILKIESQIKSQKERKKATE